MFAALLMSTAFAQQARLCEDVYPDIQRGLADPFAAWLAWAPSERVVLLDVFRCQERWFQQQNAPATVEQAAALHVLAALQAFSETDPELKDTAGKGHTHFCSARVLRPDLPFPEESLPEDLANWWSAPCDQAAFTRVVAGPWVVDGNREAREMPERPDLRPYLFQETDGVGEVVRSVVVAPGMAAPVLTTPDWFRGRDSEAKKGPSAVGLGLTAVGVGAAAAGSVMVWQATVLGPEKFSGTLAPEGWDAWRSDVLVPTRTRGIALIGVGAAALMGATFTFVL